MNSSSRKSSAGKVFLGIDGGGTRTVALLADESGRALHRAETGPANVKLLSDAELTSLFHGIAASFPRPDGLGIGLAGAWTETERRKVRDAAQRAWPGVPCHATNDLETALLAEEAHSFADLPNGNSEPKARVLIVSGTGSCCFGRCPGREAKVGGWGHVLGDKGSGYEISLRALKAVASHYDHEGVWPDLGRRFLRALQLNEPNDLVGWVQAASKKDIASLTVEVFTAWERNDKIAAAILREASNELARDAVACAHRLARRSAPVQFVLTGSVLLKQPRFRRQLTRRLHQLWPTADVAPIGRESVWGAIAFARRCGAAPGCETVLSRPTPPPARARDGGEEVRSARLSPTEKRNPRSMKLDRLSVTRAVRVMLTEDAKVPRALLAQRKQLTRAVRAVARAFRLGGRLFYVGAGTSGRLGILDASECPVTFRSSPEMVQGIIAGGQAALWSAVEGAEDNRSAGTQAIVQRRAGRRDVVLGIAASGTTPFVWGALAEARRRGATTGLLCFNPYLVIPKPLQPDIVISANLGPEVLTGSTRLKAGTATKLVLNIITTLAMVRIGKVISNLMVDVVPGNLKLRDRAVRIVQVLTDASYAEAERALKKSGWVITKSCARLGRR